MARVRLYVDHPLAEGQPVPLGRDEAHYLFGVMRLGQGAELALFNGQDEARYQRPMTKAQGGLAAAAYLFTTAAHFWGGWALLERYVL